MEPDISNLQIPKSVRATWLLPLAPTLERPGQLSACPALALVHLPVGIGPRGVAALLVEHLLGVVLQALGLVAIQVIDSAVIPARMCSHGVAEGSNPLSNLLPAQPPPHALAHVLVDQILSLALLLIVPSLVALIVADGLQQIQCVHIVSVVLKRVPQPFALVVHRMHHWGSCHSPWRRNDLNFL